MIYTPNFIISVMFGEMKCYLLICVVPKNSINGIKVITLKIHISNIGLYKCFACYVTNRIGYIY